MANPYDQFDRHPETPTTTVATPTTPHQATNPYNQFDRSDADVLPPSHTTAPGVAASLGRGLAPVAVGAGIGGLIGGPPGAITGAAMVGVGELGVGVYNQLADVMGWPKGITPQEMTDKVLDWAGVRRPQTGVERVAEAVGGGIGGTTAMIRGAERVAATAAPGVVRRVAGELSRNPRAQTVGAGISSAAAQTATEMGASPLVSWGVGAATGGVVPSTLPGRARNAAVAARQAGYVLPPGMISERRGLISTVGSAGSGRVKAEQEASYRNIQNTNRLAREDLNDQITALGGGPLPADQPFDQGMLERLRDFAGQVYQRVGQIYQGTGRVVQLDSAYAREIRDLSQIPQAMRQRSPRLLGTPEIDQLERDLQAEARFFSPEAGLQYSRRFRHFADHYFRDRTNPNALDLGSAYRAAAQAIEDLMERDLTRAGHPDLMRQLQDARRLIAKTYDVQYALNANGDVVAQRLHALNSYNIKGVRRRALDGRLETISNLFGRFREAMRNPTYTEDYSVLDFVAAASMLPHHPTGALAVGMRLPMRRLMLSRPYQNFITGQGGRVGRAIQQIPQERGIFPYIAPTYGIVPDRDTLTMSPDQPR